MYVPASTSLRCTGRVERYSSKAAFLQSDDSYTGRPRVLAVLHVMMMMMMMTMMIVVMMTMMMIVRILRMVE